MGGDGKIHYPHQISQCLEAGTSGGGGTSNRPMIVLNSTKEISEMSKQDLYQTTTCLSGDFLVRHFLSQVREKDLPTPEELCSSRYAELRKPNGLSYYSLRTSKGYSITKGGKLSEPSSPRLMNWGMMRNGKCLTLKTSVCRRTGNECSLSDILEDKVEDKYFLSDKQMNLIFSRPKNYQCKSVTASGQTIPLDSQTKPMFQQTSRIHDPKGISPTVPTASGGNHIPMICESEGSRPPNVKDSKDSRTDGQKG